MLPSEINVPHENDRLNPQEDHEVDRKDNSAGAEVHEVRVMNYGMRVNKGSQKLTLVVFRSQLLSVWLSRGKGALETLRIPCERPPIFPYKPVG